MKPKKTKEKPELIECPRCEGQGKTVRLAITGYMDFDPTDSETYGIIETCYQCGGKGKVKKEW